MTKDATSSTQSTFAVSVPLPTDTTHGSSVFIGCTKNELGDISASTTSPQALTDNTVGFALAKNTISNPNNTVVNDFDVSYSSQKDLTQDNHRFAALPKASKLIWQSITSEAPACTVYLSARVSPSLPTGDYLVRLTIDVRQNVAITYNANGGMGAFTEYVPKGTTALTIPDTLYRTGYCFVSYNTAADGTGISYAPGDTITVQSDMTLYAQWEAGITSITLDKNTGDADGSATATYGSTSLTTFTAPTYTDYIPVGYFTAGGTKVIDESGALVPDVSGYTDADGTWIRDEGSLTLYAHWEVAILRFTVSVDDNDEFVIPTCGRSATGGDIAYAWDIEWGDGTTDTNMTGTAHVAVTPTGISHSYKNADTYTITIRPHDSSAPFQWARAFGFTVWPSSSPINASRAKVTSIITMSAKGFLQNATSTGDFFLSSTWQGCTSLTTAVVPDTSNWEVASIGDVFLGSTWQGCTSLTTAAIPDTSNWEVASIGDFFLRGTWQGCTSLTAAVVPDTSNWDVGELGSDFLSYTWSDCTSLKDLSDIKFADSFKTVSNFYSGSGNWRYTFYLNNDDPTTTGAQPSFYTLGPITAGGVPEEGSDTFQNRSGMIGYSDLDDFWK